MGSATGIHGWLPTEDAAMSSVSCQFELRRAHKKFRSRFSDSLNVSRAAALRFVESFDQTAADNQQLLRNLMAFSIQLSPLEREKRGFLTSSVLSVLGHASIEYWAEGDTLLGALRQFDHQPWTNAVT